MIGEGSSTEQTDRRYRETFDLTIRDTFSQAVRIITADPALAIPGTVILRHQRKAAAVRTRHEQDGLLVPPVMIVSVTSRCNLVCSGCYMHGRGERPDSEMSPEILASVVEQAAGIGVSVIVLAGGEPLIRHEEIIRLARAHPRVLFPVFTNGLLIDDRVADAIAGCKNIVPVVSFEGFREDTDARRGSGVYDRLLSVCTRLKDRGVFYGCSMTTTRTNLRHVTGEAFVRQRIDAGARVMVFVEFVPMTPDAEELVLVPEQKKTLQVVLSENNRKFPALFLGFPGDEDTYGGCLAAGRGFVHVSPTGNLEPCPAAPYSDVNLTSVSLKEALASRLLCRLREKPEYLTETAGGCALRANPAWVEELMVGG